jgi:hypothetical protein
MTPQEKEAFYDEHIAPKLLELGQLCKDKELDFLACVEWEPGEGGTTACLGAGAGENMRRALHTLQNGTARTFAITISSPER